MLEQPCPTCGVMLDINIHVCPHCGLPRRRLPPRRPLPSWLLIVGTLLLLPVLAVLIGIFTIAPVWGRDGLDAILGVVATLALCGIALYAIFHQTNKSRNCR